MCSLICKFLLPKIWDLLRKADFSFLKFAYSMRQGGYSLFFVLLLAILQTCPSCQRLCLRYVHFCPNLNLIFFLVRQIVVLVISFRVTFVCLRVQQISQWCWQWCTINATITVAMLFHLAVFSQNRGQYIAGNLW